MTKSLNVALKIKGGGREGGTCEVIRPCHPPPPPKKLKCAQGQLDFCTYRGCLVYQNLTLFGTGGVFPA